MTKPIMVIGIAGGSGSGKSTIVERLMRGPFGGSIALLPHDAYYFDASLLPQTEDGVCNWDHPSALDNQLYLSHIQRLCSGQSVAQPIYDFTCHRRSSITQPVIPKPILLLEGILLLAIPEICHHIDLRVFVDTPSDIRLMRRTLRDLEVRGRDVKSVAAQYTASVRPMYEQFVEPSRYHAHVWIPWLVENHTALELIECRLAAALAH